MYIIIQILIFHTVWCIYIYTQGQSSPHSSAGADDAAELAGLFSPLPNTGNTSTGGSGGKRYGSSNKKARVSSSTVDR